MLTHNDVSWTQKARNNFPTIPLARHLIGGAVATHDEQDVKDLQSRNKQLPKLLARKEEASKLYDEAEKELNDFRDNVAAYRVADNHKKPTADETSVMLAVRASVSSITLTGPGHGVSDIDRQIAAHAVALKKKSDTLYKSYNEASKVIYYILIVY